MSTLASALKVLGGISIGVGIGTQWARIELDRYYRQKGEEFVSQQYRVMQAAWTDRKEAEAPVAAETDLDGPDLSSDAIVVGGSAVLMADQSILDQIDLPQADYNTHAAEYAGPNMLDGISYITEDDYNEEEGNEKEQITIHLGGDEAVFIHGGVAITNWQDLIGDTILVDFFRKFQPHDVERVLYIRNHRRGEDYEVWQAVP